LKHINDITKVYYISLGTEDSYVGLFFFIFSLVISVLMILSLLFLFKDNFHPFFMFLPDDLWIVTVLGSILLLWVPSINYGEVEMVKCHLNPLYMTVGFTLNICPTFYKLIVLFPEENKITCWVVKHKYLFLIFNVVIDISLCSISLINPYTPQYVLIEDGESFEKCNFNGIYSIIIPFIYKLLVIILMLFLIFVEWNISTTIYDMKFILIVQYIDILFIVLIFVFHIIEIKNYIGYFILHSVSTFAVSLSNYLFLFGIRIFLGFIRKQNMKIQFINNINNKFINNETQFEKNNKYDKNVLSIASYEVEGSKNNTTESESLNKSKFISRMIDYHYKICSNSDNLNSTKNSSITITTATVNNF